jgi:hypothetical protein
VLHGRSDLDAVAFGNLRRQVVQPGGRARRFQLHCGQWLAGEVMCQPQVLGQHLESSALLATQLTAADAELVGHHVPVEAPDVTIEERVVNAPAARLRRIIRGRPERLDCVHQDTLERRSRVEVIRDAEGNRQRAAPQLVRIIEVVERAAHVTYKGVEG